MRFEMNWWMRFVEIKYLNFFNTFSSCVDLTLNLSHFLSLSPPLSFLSCILNLPSSSWSWKQQDKGCINSNIGWELLGSFRFLFYIGINFMVLLKEYKANYYFSLSFEYLTSRTTISLNKRTLLLLSHNRLLDNAMQFHMCSNSELESSS